MTRTTVDEALRAVRANPYRVWSSPKPESARSRFEAGGFAAIHHRPKFRIAKDDPIFTIGSCFARNVEDVLAAAGYDVLTRGFGVPASLYFDHPQTEAAEAAEVDLPGALNKYNVASMRVEIERCLGRRPDIPDDGLIEVAPGSWYDPHASFIRPGPIDAIRGVRRRIEDTNGRVRRAKVVFVTLGLTETWYDARTGLALNMVPPPQTMKAAPDRYLFANAGIADVLTDLRALLAVIRQTCGADLKVVLTVSPVPLNSTWTDMDVVTANTLSKATLRAAAGVVAAEEANTDYFPSFEMVQATPRALAYEADAIHVTAAMVEHIMATFTRVYCA